MSVIPAGKIQVLLLSSWDNTTLWRRLYILIVEFRFIAMPCHRTSVRECFSVVYTAGPCYLASQRSFIAMLCHRTSVRECSSVVYTAGACYLASQRSFFAMPCRRASSHGFVQFIEQGVDQTGIAVGEFLTLDVVISMTSSGDRPATDICRPGRPAR